MEQQQHTDVEHPLTEARIACPTCKRLLRVPAAGAAGRPRFFPFCSERCKLVDLNAWLDADYRIPAQADEASEDAMSSGEASS